ncbi:MAG TPA: CPXCG motif-containing cysteine-rich protein [Gemmatimonadales bacterium]|nr:CPXCG motif-containing cysteine-rich protein [Gemmatimonadales bacterium]
MHEDDEFFEEDSLDGSAAEVLCPHCGEPVEITLDPGGGAEQQYVQDCEVCCRPWQVYVTWADDGTPEVRVEAA